MPFHELAPTPQSESLRSCLSGLIKKKKGFSSPSGDAFLLAVLVIAVSVYLDNMRDTQQSTRASSETRPRYTRCHRVNVRPTLPCIAGVRNATWNPKSLPLPTPAPLPPRSAVGMRLPGSVGDHRGLVAAARSGTQGGFACSGAALARTTWVPAFAVSRTVRSVYGPASLKVFAYGYSL